MLHQLLEQIVRKKKMILLAQAEAERKAAMAGHPGSGSFLSQLVSSAVRSFSGSPSNRQAMIATLQAEVRSRHARQCPLPYAEWHVARVE